MQIHGHAATTVEPAVYHGAPAYRLSNGKTEAVVVPSLSGRVMRFGTVGGDNWLWNAAPEKLNGDGYKNYGGDKTFAGPHPVWNTFADNLWPPDPAWDGAAHLAQVLPDWQAQNNWQCMAWLWRARDTRVFV
jgi:hypothetical protein